jgi:hypothetical protein
MRAQIAFEFIAYIAMAIIIAMSFLVLTGLYSSFVTQGQQEEELTDLSLAIQQELLVASQTIPGYHRVYSIPTRLVKGEYALTNDNNSITLIHVNGHTIVLDTPPLNGTLVKGENLLRHINGTLYIN